MCEKIEFKTEREANTIKNLIKKTSKKKESRFALTSAGFVKNGT